MDRRSQVLRVARLSPFVVVLVAPLVASGFGLVAVGHDWLGLGSWAGLLVPLTLDAAALSFAFLSWQATLDDEPAGLERLLVWVFAAASAGLNVWHADAIGGLQRAVFFGAASLTGALVWERVLHAIQRRQLRARGRIEKPAPRFRFLRWLLFPAETAGAFRFAVGEEISDPRVAIDCYRHRNDPAPATSAAPVSDEPTFIQKQESPNPVGTSATAVETPAEPAPAEPVQPVVAPYLVGLSNAACVRLAVDEIGKYSGKDARDWLTARGVHVDKSQAARVVRELRAAEATEQEPSPRLVAVGDDR